MPSSPREGHHSLSMPLGSTFRIENEAREEFITKSQEGLHILPAAKVTTHILCGFLTNNLKMSENNTILSYLACSWAKIWGKAWLAGYSVSWDVSKGPSVVFAWRTDRRQLHFLPAGKAQHGGTRVAKHLTWQLRAPRECVPRALAQSLKASYELAFKKQRICSHL